jgi:hypothetical protein
MTTGIQAGGVDLDDLFLPLETTKISDVGWFSSGFGGDISNDYEQYTSGAKVSTTGLKSSGVDLADLFQSKLVPLITVAIPDGSVSKLTQTSAAETTVGIRFNLDGTYDTFKYNTWTYAGDWITPTSAADNTYTVKNAIQSESGGSGWFTGNDDTWETVGASAAWTMRDETQPGEAHLITSTISIRKDAGSVIDTASWDFSARFLL